jgi:hypothetical protein
LALETLHVTKGEDVTDFLGFLAAVHICFQPTDPITIESFKTLFPILGNIALKAIFALSISLVYFSPTFGWIANDVHGIVHNLSPHVYTAIRIVLEVHAIDFPNHPVEARTYINDMMRRLSLTVYTAGLLFIHYIVQWSIDEIIRQRNKTKLFARIFVGYYNVSPRNTDAENLAVYSMETTTGHYLHLWFEDVSMLSLSVFSYTDGSNSNVACGWQALPSR